MSTRIRVSVAELRDHWMSPDARGIANNLQLGMRIVTMRDGTQYEAPLDEVSAALKAEDAADVAMGRDDVDVIEERAFCDPEPTVIAVVHRDGFTS